MNLMLTGLIREAFGLSQLQWDSRTDREGRVVLVWSSAAIPLHV
jgi:hypothetical protein